MTQEQYRVELAGVGLAADLNDKPQKQIAEDRVSAAMLGIVSQEAVDTTATLGYDILNTSQEGAVDYGTGAENAIGGNGRNTEVNPGVLSIKGTANSGGDVRPGDPRRIPGGYGERTIHTSDSEGREQPLNRLNFCKERLRQTKMVHRLLSNTLWTTQSLHNLKKEIRHHIRC